MKLYLSSYFLGNDPAKFAELFGANKKVAIIMNAADTFGPAKRPDYLKKGIASLSELGLEGEDLDLRDYFNDHTGLAAKLQQYGGVWVVGGNSFTLRRALRQSGFDQIAPDLVRSDSLVYGGFSAGAVVAGKTLEGIELVDNPEQLPEGYEPKVVWEGLGLYEKSIAPHYKSDHPESAAIDKVVDYFEEKNMPHIALHDGEAIVVKT
ncbi:MAG TPA: Type 1 glutamine amidotransferase-like domain-containing protein [Candidatus Saccharimonadales bacterium]|nr:Type 1 glutamine amidotransferase-like domain-containing protein [Candidatus Saccharimonadales bacterium]